jgi:hypothetical protein
MNRLDEIREREAKATKGRWCWRVNQIAKTVELIARQSWGNLILDPQRWGMRGATLRFNVDGVMESAQNLSVVIPGEEHHEKWNRTLEHPDANFISESRTDIPYLLERLEAAESALGEIAQPESLCWAPEMATHTARSYFAKWSEK